MSHKLAESDHFLIHIKMSYNWFNRKELLQKAKDRYHNCSGKINAADYYLVNSRVFFKKAKNKYESLSEEE